MVAGHRVFAIFLDFAILCALYLVILATIVVFMLWGVELIPNGNVVFVLWFLLMGVVGFSWVAYLIVPPVLWGRTLGKMIVGLYVLDARGATPSLLRLLARELLKLLSISSGIGIVLTLIEVLLHQQVWYDNLCGTTVEYRPRTPCGPAREN